MGDTYRTTMADVAKAAGVSRTTVSFVLNNRDGARIPSQTRERVKQVAAELGYRPHGGARALASRRTSLIGLVSEIVTSPFAAATIRGIQDTVRAAGYTLFIVPTSTEATVDGEAFETLLKSRVEGMHLRHRLELPGSHAGAGPRDPHCPGPLRRPGLRSSLRAP